MICFAISGLSQYMARCIGLFVASSDEEVVVVATRPRVPIMGMEECVHCRIVWTDASGDVAEVISEIGVMPRVLIEDGWNVVIFNDLRNKVHDVGGKVVCMVDNNYRFSVKECVKSLRFRLMLRNRYDGFLVPGVSGVKLLRFYGVPADKISRGMYSADRTLFCPGPSLEKRQKKIMYVGQFVDRKNVIRMCMAFREAVLSCPQGREWTLELFGCGVLRERLENEFAGENVVIHDFVQPEELSKRYREVRAFCLPSLEDHWGLVVHEAALSGCALLLSNRVGAAEDFLCEKNGILFNPYDVNDMEKAFIRIMECEDDWSKEAFQVSLRLASTISMSDFVKGLQRHI